MIDWSLAIPIIGCIAFVFFICWLCLRVPRHERDDIDGTELSVRNRPYPPAYWNFK